MCDSQVTYDDDDDDDEVFIWIRHHADSAVRALGSAPTTSAAWQWQLSVGESVAVACQVEGFMRIPHPNKDGYVDYPQNIHRGYGNAPKETWFEGVIRERVGWLGAEDEVLVVDVPNQLVHCAGMFFWFGFIVACCFARS